MRKQIFLLVFAVFPVLGMNVPGESPFYTIHVVDQETGRGVPLVELKTTNEMRYYTDSNGVVAFAEPGLMGLEVFFSVTSHGYDYPADGFGCKGLRLHPEAGKEATIKLPRKNLAERLYRITGQGIYRDSILAGIPVPIKQPVLNGQVMGQDSALAIPYQGKIYWFWGDTGRPQYPLGQFQTSGAVSELPGQGGLAPEKGIDLTYFVNAEGFSRPMAPIKDEGAVWIEGLMLLPDTQAKEHLYCSYSRMKNLGAMLEQGIMVFNDQRQEFSKLTGFALDKKWQRPKGHAVRNMEKGDPFYYFPVPYPIVRVQAEEKAVVDQSNYESFTCLKAGTRFKGKESELTINNGKVEYAWQRDTEPISPKEEKQLFEAGLLKEDDLRFLPKDVDSGKRIVMHGASVNWNEYRKKWILIGVQEGGTSFLGEIWYSESDVLTGPWRSAQKVVTHDKYTFYNPVHHPFFDQEQGRIIYFEGTYTNQFSDTKTATPAYDYNQIMYRLDLAKLR